MMRPDDRPVEGLAGPARGHDEPWRTGFGAVVSLALTLALCFLIDPFFARLAIQNPSLPWEMWEALACIGLLAIATGLTVHLFHARRARTIWGPSAKVRRDFVVTFFGVGLLLVAATGLNLALQPVGPQPNLEPGLWLKLLPISLALLAWQVVGEEMAFRGYLLQQLAARFRHPVWWIGLPSLLFGLAHFSASDFGANAAWVALWAGLFGAALADLTGRTGNIGAALGVHLANNCLALLVMALPGEAASLALFILPIAPQSAEFARLIVPSEFLLLVLMWLTARLVLRR